MLTFSLSCTISQPETELTFVKLAALEELLFLLWLPKPSLVTVSLSQEFRALWKIRPALLVSRGIKGILTLLDQIILYLHKSTLPATLSCNSKTQVITWKFCGHWFWKLNSGHRYKIKNIKYDCFLKQVCPTETTEIQQWSQVWVFFVVWPITDFSIQLMHIPS